MSEATPDLSDAWILDQRPPKNRVDPARPYAYLVERERGNDGRIADVATIFLTNNECPFRCLMCDLWKNTTDAPVAAGQIPEQVQWALERLPPARVVKLYNSGNFFDPNAIPEVDYSAIAELVTPFETVIVESHPRFVGRRCFDFGEMVQGDLEVALGLETVHPEVLAKLNKRMTLKDFKAAVRRLRDHAVQARAFILLRPPFLSEEEGVLWAQRSLDFAFEVGVECCVIIPTRAGNGALEALANLGLFAPPSLDSLESVHAYGLRLGRGRVLVDLWDAERVLPDAPAKVERFARLARMNLAQAVEPPVNGQSRVEH